VPYRILKIHSSRVKDGEIRRADDDPNPEYGNSRWPMGETRPNYDDKAPTPLQPCDFRAHRSCLGSRIETSAN